MLAYTTLSNYIHAPSALEVAVYVAGLLMVVGLPALLFSLIDKQKQEKGKN